MTVRANKPAFNIREKLKSLDYSHVPYDKVQPGGVVQIVTREVTNAFAATTTNGINVTNWYIDVSPKMENSIFHYETNWTVNNNSGVGYNRWSIIDTNHPDNIKLNSNLYIAGDAYYAGTSEWINTYASSTFTASRGLATMRVQLFLYVQSGTTTMTWSSSDNRVIKVTEIAQ